MSDRRHVLGLSALSFALIAGPGCGGNVPASGSRAALPDTYKQREKEIMDSMKASAKGRPSSPARPSARH
ncbi:hypothetical protein EP7_002546 [Isosphaeraceae bacterium EP7]